MKIFNFSKEKLSSTSFFLFFVSWNIGNVYLMVHASIFLSSLFWEVKAEMYDVFAVIAVLFLALSVAIHKWSLTVNE